MKKKLVGIMLAVMVASQGMVAFAAPADNNPKGDQHTTIGIMEAEKPVGQPSFELLYYDLLFLSHERGIYFYEHSNQSENKCPRCTRVQNRGHDIYRESRR